MVVVVPMVMDKHIVHVHKIIVVDDANSDIIHTIMSIYIKIHINMANKNLTFSSMNNKKHNFILTLNKIKDCVLNRLYIFNIFNRI